MMFLKHHLPLALACLGTISSSAAVPLTDRELTTPNNGGYHNAAYYVNWAIYARNFLPNQLPVNKLTHVYYAFANLFPNGTVYLSDTWSDTDKKFPTDTANDTAGVKNVYGCVKQLYLLKKHNRQMKTLLSIGGATFSNNFAGAASTDATRAEFAATAVALLKDLGFDGLNIDWQTPETKEESRNFVLLLQAIRCELDAYANKYAPGYHFLITVASPAGPAKYSVLDLKAIDKVIDTWHLMAYDYAGAWSNLTAHASNLLPDPEHPDTTPFSTERAVNDYISAGVTAAKIVMGIPLFGRSFQNTEGLGKPFNGTGMGSWEEGAWDYKALPRAGADEHQTKAYGTYSYDKSTKELISYDNVHSTEKKASYIKKNGLGGAMFWESSGDKVGNESLISTTSSVLKDLDCSQNWLDYSASQYVNLAKGMPEE